MKFRISRYLSIILLSLISLYVQYCYAAAIDKIVVFGDSMSDNGNIFSLTTLAHKTIPLIPIIPKDPPYYQGRFSNGPVWVDNLAQAMNVPELNYAYGGSWAEPILDSGMIIPFGLGMQVNFYLVSAALDFNKEQHLYVIWSGGNDYVGGRSDPEYATSNTVASIKAQIEWLIYYGAKNILVMNLPDLGTIPEVTANGSDATAIATRVSQLHNQKLADMIAKEKGANTDVKIVLADITRYFNDIIASPEKYGLKNVSEGCYKGGYWLRANKLTANSKEIQAAKKANIDILNSPSLRIANATAQSVIAGEQACSNPDEYMFWDHIHPTRVMHRMLATMALNLLNENGITGPTK